MPAIRSAAPRFIVVLLAAVAAPFLVQAQQPAKKPNIVCIMADVVGWFNLSCYHQGIMASRTPYLDQLAREGMRFTDYYAEASCTAGRANFITGQLPIRTGLTGSLNDYNWFVYEFWRFVHVHQEVAKLAATAIEFPPMQKPASFNLEAVKAQVEESLQKHQGR